jgi:hypothetical protein
MEYIFTIQNIKMIKPLLLSAFVLSITASFAQTKKPVFSIEGGVNLNHYTVTLATVGPDQQPAFHKAMGNYAKLGVAMAFGKKLQGQLSVGYSSERISADVRRTDNTPVGTISYPYEVNALQHLADIETKLSLVLPVSATFSITPSFGIGSSAALSKSTNSYSYLLPGLKLGFGRFGIQANYKMAHYNVEPVQNTEFFQMAPRQFLVRPRVIQAGFTYQIL